MMITMCGDPDHCDQRDQRDHCDDRDDRDHRAYHDDPDYRDDDYNAR